ncbi:MAG: retropepsin-like aspartic protease family protein [Gammaproteobacteria bacterium]
MTATGVKTGDDAKSQRRRGGWLMIAIGWTAALLLVTAFFGGALDERQNPNSAEVLAGQGDGEIILRANAFGHYYAEGTMNGSRVLFLLDTGATQIAVPQAVADNIGLVAGDTTHVNTANGIAQVRQTTIENITIGNISLTGLRGAILPNMDGDAILLGMNALGRLNLSQKGGGIKSSFSGRISQQDGELRLSVPQQ